jgi:hypothetical protein
MSPATTVRPRRTGRARDVLGSAWQRLPADPELACAQAHTALTRATAQPVPPAAARRAA